MTDSNFPFYIAIFAITFLITVVAERIMLPRLKSAGGQPIYDEGPKWHITKSGTPTMGGLAFIIAVCLSLTLAVFFLILKGLYTESLSLISCIVYAVFNAVIGIIDDRTKLKNKKNKGLTPKQKIILQSLGAILFLLFRAILLNERGIISVSYGEINLGILYYPLAFIILLGITNCANLTDGIDGLASGVAFAIGVSLFYLSCALCYEACFTASAIMGAATGFLVFNMHPAKIFMGDTGSLFLGSLVASSSFMLKSPPVIIFLGGVYVIEGLSVILQVAFFKLTKKRLFKMAPLHHHLEKCGWSENRICIVAIIATFIMSIPAFIFYLP